jgi:hypothetical protein
MEKLGNIEKTYLGLVEATFFFLMMPRDESWVWDDFYQTIFSTDFSLACKVSMLGNLKVFSVQVTHTICQVCFYFGKQCLYTIEEVFKWDTEGGWDEFWFQGVKKSGEELEFYKLLMGAKLEDKPETNVVSEDSDKDS